MAERSHAQDDVNGPAMPLDESMGYTVRLAYFAFVRDLQDYLAGQDVPMGLWYFLRALEEEDGLTQSQLSHRVGTTAPSTVEQLRNMEARGLIERRPSTIDRRKTHIHLTVAGRALNDRLMPYVWEVNRAALEGFTAIEVSFIRLALHRMRQNLRERRRMRRDQAGKDRSQPSN